jgi:putative ABC transport system permease protein
MAGVSRKQLIILRLLLVDSALALRARRMQAVLSAFGIATGIAAVVLLVSLVSGLHRMALQTLNTRGANVVVVTVNQDPSASAPAAAPLTISADDADAVLRASPYFDRAAAENGASAVVRGVVAPGGDIFFVMGAAGPMRVNLTRAYQIQLTGLMPAGFEMLNLQLASGRLPAAEEFERGARVVVLGARSAQQIFGDKSGVGETIVLGDWPFTVIAVLAWVGEPSGEFTSPADRAVYAPFKTVGTLFRGNDTANRLSLRVTTPGTEALAIADARGILSRRQRRLGATAGQLEFTNALEQLREVTLVLSGLKLLVGLVGGIGLFVGAVGVANVLLVSVRERTVEIGIRRAMGARRQHIFLGFLFESLAITLGGGVIGIAIAWVLTKIALFLPIPNGAEPHISLITAAVAVSLLVVVGLVAGVGPARRAAAVYPVEALRAE